MRSSDDRLACLFDDIEFVDFFSEISGVELFVEDNVIDLLKVGKREGRW